MAGNEIPVQTGLRSGHPQSQAKEGVAAKKPSAQPPHPFCTLLLAAEAATNTDTARKAGVTMPHHARSWAIAKRQGWCKRPPVGGKQPLEETRKETPQSVCKGPKHWRKKLMEEGSRELKVGSVFFCTQHQQSLKGVYHLNFPLYFSPICKTAKVSLLFGLVPETQSWSLQRKLLAFATSPWQHSRGAHGSSHC